MRVGRGPTGSECGYVLSSTCKLTLGRRAQSLAMIRCFGVSPLNERSLTWVIVDPLALASVTLIESLLRQFYRKIGQGCPTSCGWAQVRLGMAGVAAMWA